VKRKRRREIAVFLRTHTKDRSPQTLELALESEYSSR
jgi:hypothetical protein